MKKFISVTFLVVLISANVVSGFAQFYVQFIGKSSHRLGATEYVIWQSAIVLLIAVLVRELCIVVGSGRVSPAWYNLSRWQVIRVWAILSPRDFPDKDGKVDFGVIELIVEVNPGKRRYLRVELNNTQEEDLNIRSTIPFKVGHYYRYIGDGKIESLPIGKN